MDVDGETNIGPRLYLVQAKTFEEARNTIMRFAEPTALQEDVQAFSYAGISWAYLGVLYKEGRNGREVEAESGPAVERGHRQRTEGGVAHRRDPDAQR